MKNLILFIIFFLSTYSLSAQLSLDVTMMITIKNNKKTVEKIEGRINVNSDTTEIEVEINEISFKEKIGDLSLFNDFGDVKVYIYNQEEGYLVIQIREEKLIAVTFGTESGKLQFE